MAINNYNHLHIYDLRIIAVLLIRHNTIIY